MISFPNAKINIGLSITSKREDGFHNLISCFYPIRWNDILEILPADKITFRSTGIPIPGNLEDNLCLKAFHLLSQDFTLTPVAIHLHKAIPIGAGLGGGSADAAFTLTMLNELFLLDLTSTELKNYARKIGSDCAFFVDNVPVIAIEKGDVFEAVNLNLQDKFIVLIYPNLHIPTSDAYQGIIPKASENNLSDFLNRPISQWKNRVINDFEKGIALKHPIINDLKNMLYDQGAQYASMTGSGSTVFGIFDYQPSLPKVNNSFTIWEGKL